MKNKNSEKNIIQALKHVIDTNIDKLYNYYLIFGC